MATKNEKFYGQTLLVLAGIFGVMFLLNHWMPLHRDDYDYSMIWLTSGHVESFADVIQSAWRHYFLHGGRLITVFWLDTFLWLGKFWFDLANALMFVALVVLLYFHARRSTALWQAPVLLVAAALLAWLSFPHFGEVAVWKSGSTVYLWSAVPAAFFLLPYNLFLKEKPVDTKNWRILPMFLLGILAGWSVENLAVTVTVVSAGIAWHCHRQGNMPWWMASGSVGALIGLIGIVAAPGNYVRYDQQGSGKGILAHIGNQFAGNGEMVLYILPVILLLLCAWRICKLELAKKKGFMPAMQNRSVSSGQWIMLGFILLLVVSYFNGSFVAWGIRDVLYVAVMVPIGKTDVRTIDHFDNLFAGFDEMAIYWLTVFFVYGLIKKRLGLTSAVIREMAKMVTAKEVWQAFPAIRYAGYMIALALFNNLVMLAAPTFPARATFSSTAMILIALLAILQEPLIGTTFRVQAGRILLLGAAGIGLFTMTAALIITHTMQQENNLRLAIVQEAAKRGEEIAYMKPITLRNRALRHVFFADFDNNVTKEGLCKYYGIKDIVVQPPKASYR